jgi:hypothetical protein
MWAVESGIAGPDVRDDIIDYLCATTFGWSPEVTAMQGAEKVEALLTIHQAVRDKEKRDTENASKG